MSPPVHYREHPQPELRGLRVRVDGIVQGVGYRPFVWRLATELGLGGQVRNVSGRVEIHATGSAEHLDALIRRLTEDAPPRARVDTVDAEYVSDPYWAQSHRGPFRIEPSAHDTATAHDAQRHFPPDLATCSACLADLRNPADRRFAYPFTNCTDCGPRATIIDDLPYDRAVTTMSAFVMCTDCAAEYTDPTNRRFHAEPIACPRCGPSATYRGAHGTTTTADHGPADPIDAAATDLLAGRIVAVKGLGGYHLACDATDEAVVSLLRERKHRWAKPLAVMVADLDAARELAHIDDAEAAVLTGPRAPIVLLRPRAVTSLAPGVPRGSAEIGVLLAYTPLHHLLMARVGRPIVLTSGNLADEPLATDDADAAERLASIADSFLVHDRPIRARYDDSLVRVVDARTHVVRRGRGYAPEALLLPVPTPRPLLAVGAELKHTFTLARGGLAHVAPHNGDLEDLRTHEAFTDSLAHLSRLLALDPEVVVHDRHPEYLSTKWAVRNTPAERRLAVQHHHAHVASCAAEHGVVGPFLGVAYDGLGMGDDGTMWGGEIFAATLRSYRRVARFSRAPLPGGALAVHRPYRMALGYLLGGEEFGGPEFDPDLTAGFFDRLDPREVANVGTQVRRGFNAPLASSAGRLMDTAAVLLGLRDVVEYEAQAAIDLERAAGDRAATALPYRVVEVDGLNVFDARVTLAALLAGVSNGVPVGDLAAAMHETVVEVTREMLSNVRESTATDVVCMSGGVLQNSRLAASLTRQLAGDGFEVYLNEQVPCNDGGISYGQAAVAAATLAAARSDDRVEI